MKLRAIQEQPVRVATEYLAKDNSSPKVMVLPTAFGKSVVIAFALKNLPNEKFLILQPSKELLEQNYSKYTMLGETASIFSASMGVKEIGNITFATIGSIQGIGSKFKELGITKLIIDECHLFPRKQESMIGKFLAESEIKTILGLTATPFRLQGAGSFGTTLKMLTSKSKEGNLFTDIIYVGQIKEMIENKFWSKLKYESFEFDESKLEFNSSGSDFTEKSIESSFNHNGVKGAILDYLDQTDRKHILVFVPSVDEAENMCSLSDNAAVISAKTPKKERDYIITEFKAGNIKTIFNVNVLSVGFDYTKIDLIIMARPTASLAWYYQVIGRGTRIDAEKKNCIIADFVGNVKRFGKVEDLYYEKEKLTWKLFGTKDILLTGIPLESIGTKFKGSASKSEPDYFTLKQKPQEEYVLTFGKHQGKKVSETPRGWRNWVLENFQWNTFNKKLKTEIERVNKIEDDELNKNSITKASDFVLF